MNFTTYLKYIFLSFADGKREELEYNELTVYNEVNMVYLYQYSTLINING